MGLPKNLNFLRFGTGGQTLDIYLDPLCPFSYKCARSLTENVLPQVREGGKYAGKLQLIIRPYPQPFHYFSTYPCEALLCFGVDHPEQWWDYLLGVFSVQEQFFNKPVHDKTPAQVQEAYVKVAEDVLQKAGVANAQAEGKKLYEQLQVHAKENGGSVMFEPLKYLIKEGRQNGIHFTPTALLNGLEDNTVSSGWGKSEWDKWLEEKLGPQSKL